MSKPTAPPAIDPAANLWPGADGGLVECREKLRVLQENHSELTQCLQDCFEDAVLMGVDAGALRTLLHRMVDALQKPGKPGAAS